MSRPALSCPLPSAYGEIAYRLWSYLFPKPKTHHQVYWAGQLNIDTTSHAFSVTKSLHVALSRILLSVVGTDQSSRHALTSFFQRSTRESLSLISGPKNRAIICEDELHQHMIRLLPGLSFASWSPSSVPTECINLRDTNMNQ